MAWTISRRFLFGLSSSASILGSCYWGRTIYADEASAPSGEVSKKRTDPLVDHEWMASGIGGWKGVKITWYDYASLPNKNDRFASLAFRAVSMNHGSNWVYSVLSEGLRGWETSVFIYNALISTTSVVLTSFIEKYTTPLGDPAKMHPSAELKSDVPSEGYDNSIKKAFRDVDHGIVNQAQQMIFSSPLQALNTIQLSAAVQGTTAMLSFYDDESRILKIANTGDGRAVVGRPSRREDGTLYIEVHVLTTEHTSANPVEQARLLNSHPDTDIGILQKYIGRDITRAFGLSMCKWSQEVQKRMHKEYFCEPPLSNLYVQSDRDSVADGDLRPYLTAEPEITTFHVQSDDFLIMANKGLWNSLTSEEAVGLVGAWVRRKNYSLQSPIPDPTDEHIIDREILPVDLPDESEDTTIWYKRWKLPKRFICVDNIASAHLVRNALGGANIAFTEGLLKVPHPFSANNRDEIAVSVTFFE
ncbi:protein serine/threonine phosphatase 2C [Macrolepiota fuliginosa MF-IS2]|uniref:Protein serine/threonine phosphatase 2C n=1 Tax=Macrolepiota fuliginosa MF-IS2 TaxID=1400762 RepID=A0A9P5X8R5_9AGAR|nr:protein serine/threonine phosphatase 2C [Macrolepiota fuliginosa MF-IS2]